MRLGIGSWTYGWSIGVAGYPPPSSPLTSMDVLHRARDFGLDLVQLGDNLPVNEMSSAERVRARDYAADSGIAIEIGTIGIETEHLLHYLDLAVFFSAKLICVLPRTTQNDPGFAVAEESIRSVLHRYRSAGVALALENYEQYPSTELRALVQRITDPYVGICLDTVNSLGALETLERVVEALAPYILNLHIKDFKIRRVPSRMGYEVTGCPVGDGQLDVGRLLSELRRHGVTPTLILEQWTPWLGSIENTMATEERWAAQSIRFLERYKE